MLQSVYERARIPLYAATAAFLIHLVCNPHYGFFGDELYFIVCGQHPQWNYVDQPPVAPLLAAASQAFGPSLVLLRAVPALFAGAGIYVTCLVVIEFGGAAYAQILSAIVVFFLPVLTDFGMKVSPDMVGLCSWPLIALWIVRLTKGANPRLWVAIGVLMGVSILSKYSVLFFAVALLMGLLLTPERRILYSRWFVVGTVISALMALPAFLWQVHYGYPMLELLRAVQQGKNVIVGPLGYLGQQLLISGLLAEFWIIGLAWLLLRPRFRFLAYGYVLLIAMMIVKHGKHYYPANVYPYLVAAGCVQIEDLDQQTPYGTRCALQRLRSTRVGFLSDGDARASGSATGEVREATVVALAHFERERRYRTPCTGGTAIRLPEHAWLDGIDRHRESRLPGTSSRRPGTGGGVGTELQ